MPSLGYSSRLRLCSWSEIWLCGKGRSCKLSREPILIVEQTKLLYNPILALVKTSILPFLLRLTGQKTNVWRTIWGLLIFNGAMVITTFLLTVLHCIPIRASRDVATPNSTCLNFADFVTGTASISILTDALVLMLLTWIVYNLQIQKKQKSMLIGILSFGFV